MAKKRRALEGAHDRQRRGLEGERVHKEKAYKTAISAWIAEQD